MDAVLDNNPLSDTILNAHNKYRAYAGLPPMMYDNELGEVFDDELSLQK